MNIVHYVMERLGADAAEQGDAEVDVIDWLSNRSYDWTRLWEAANGDVAAIAEVRAEAGLPVLM